MRKRKTIKFSALIVVLTVLAVSGCGCFTVGVRALHWNGMIVSQEGSPFNPEGISSFSKLSYKPSPGTPPISIRMPDGRLIQPDQLNRNALNAYIRKGLARRGKYVITVMYSRGATSVRLDENGQMKTLVIDIHPVHSYKNINSKRPAIGVPGNNKLLEFPLREKDLKDLFGKPSKDETFLHGT
ncbi:hypothetical protein ACFL1X_12730 [Candidatus Hydrogenedentota bacterium]